MFQAQFGVDEMVCPLPSSNFSPKWYAAARDPPIAPAIATGRTPAGNKINKIKIQLRYCYCKILECF